MTRIISQTKGVYQIMDTEKDKTKQQQQKKNRSFQDVLIVNVVS